MHVAAVEAMRGWVIPSLVQLRDNLARKAALCLCPSRY
jgi:fumarate hydratase class II